VPNILFGTLKRIFASFSVTNDAQSRRRPLTISAELGASGRLKSRRGAAVRRCERARCGDREWRRSGLVATRTGDGWKP